MIKKGIVCPSCSSVEVIILETRLRQSTNTIYRRYSCKTCKSRFVTHETVQKIVHSL